MSNAADQKPSIIKPAEIALTPLSRNTKASGRRLHWRNLLIGSGLAGLVILALAVFFILPKQVVPERAAATTDVAAKTSTASASSDAAPPAGNAGQPWTEAQLAKQRKESQEILSELLEQQETLEKMGVTQWAPEDYSRALQLAKTGDDLYSQREFARAQENYQSGLNEFNHLLEKSETTYVDAMRNGNQALVDGNTNAAAASFELALLIKPADTEAGKGKSRAGSLDQVLSLLAQGDTLAQAGQLTEAVSLYQQAVTLDPDHVGASDRLRGSRQRITDREFTTAMSNGYAALANAELQQARKSFQGALKIKPAAQEATDALRQTENKITVITINEQLAVAIQHEQAERWPEAVAGYDKALQLDANLAIAQTGKQTAALRADLDQRLAFAIANPLRLAEQPVHTETSALYKRALTITAPGPKLQRQIADLKILLQRARQPLLVTLQSDNFTEITLYKIGMLGRFQNRQVELVPGHYVVVGKRPGYQDVRVEFTVAADTPNQTVLVQCENQITFKN